MVFQYDCCWPIKIRQVVTFKFSLKIGRRHAAASLRAKDLLFLCKLRGVVRNQNALQETRPKQNLLKCYDS